MVLYALFEHAAGYAVFKVISQEDVGALLPEVQEAVTDLEKFGRVVKLAAFHPFKSAANALENINSISEGVVHEDLKVFLESNLPVGKKKSKVALGVSDAKLGAGIQESCNICCESGGVVLEVLRGVRCHFHKMIQGLTAAASGKAQLGLGHSYSRSKVKFNVHRADNMIIQSIALVDQLDKDINTFSMRIREWYSYHFPELVKIVNDNYLYAKCANFIKSRKDLTEDKIEALEEIVMDEGKARAIYDASRSSMGMDISPIDLINIESFSKRVIGLVEYRKRLHDYLQSKMGQVAPNLQALIGDLVGARLIAHAGSLTNLAKYPASTVQILGAEKALFRALKTRGNTPKYGLIFHSSFIGRAGAKNKGRISRYLANKCSIASRIDCFTENPTNLFGKKLHDQVDDRLNFYETGEAPIKNADAMQSVMEELAELEAVAKKEEKKKKKKKKKKEEEAAEADTTQEEVTEEETPAPVAEGAVEMKEEADTEETATKKKKKKKRKSEVEEAPPAEESIETVNSTLNGTTNGTEEMEVDQEEPPKKKKKKKDKQKEPEEAETVAPEEEVNTTIEELVPKKKKKKKSKVEVEE